MIRAPTSVTSRFHRVDDRGKTEEENGFGHWPYVRTCVFERYRGASRVRLGVKLQRDGGGAGDQCKKTDYDSSSF